jgi:autotransporter-associated beta strand protein
MKTGKRSIQAIWGLAALLAAGLVQADTYTTFNNAGSYAWNAAPWSKGLPNGVSDGTNSSLRGLMQGGGTVTIDASSTGTTPQALMVGWSGNANLNITGGTLAVGNAGEGFSVGESGVGTVTQSGGTVTASAMYFNRMTNAVSSKGTYNLNGGTLAFSSLSRPAASVSTNVSALNLNGGTLKATASTASWITGAFAVNVQAGGAILDTQAYNVTVLTALLNGGGGLTKNGTGALTLAGLNTYTGDTTVSAGALLLPDNSQMLFTIGADGVNNGIGGSGTLTANGDFVFDLTGAGATAGNSWTIVDAASLTESFGATFSVASFTDNGDNTWSKQSGAVTYIFDETTGGLSVIPEPATIGMLGLGALVTLVLRRMRT